MDSPYLNQDTVRHLSSAGQTRLASPSSLRQKVVNARSFGQKGHPSANSITVNRGMNEEALRGPAKQRLTTYARNNGYRIMNWFDEPSIRVRSRRPNEAPRSATENPDIIGEAWPTDAQPSPRHPPRFFVVELKHTNPEGGPLGRGFKKAIGQAQMYNWALSHSGTIVVGNTERDFNDDYGSYEVTSFVILSGTQDYHMDFVTHLNEEIYKKSENLSILQVNQRM